MLKGGEVIPEMSEAFTVVPEVVYSPIAPEPEFATKSVPAPLSPIVSRATRANLQVI